MPIHLSLPARRTAATALLPLLLLVTGACSQTLPAPPSTLAVDETPRTVGDDAVEVGVSAAYGGALFSGEGVAVSASARYGLHEHLDLRGDVGAGVYFPPGEGLRNRPFGFARLGLERALAPGVLSLVAGLGGGATPLGGYVGADVGFSLGYENRYCVPFLGAVATASVPVTTPTLVVPDDAGPYSMRSYPSVGFVASAGLDVPVGQVDGTGHRRFGLRLNWTVGYSVGDDPLSSERGELVYMAGMLSFRAALGRGTAAQPSPAPTP